MPLPPFRERSIIVALAMLALMPAIALGQTTAISGRVTAEGSGEPLPETRVIVIGTTLFASTNGTGQYTIRGVHAGTNAAA